MGPDLTVNQLFDRNHQSILVGELIRGRGADRDTETEESSRGDVTFSLIW